MNREQLIKLCEKSIVQEDKWNDRDTSAAQMQVGHLWALLKAGCEFKVTTVIGNYHEVEVRFKDFAYFEGMRGDWDSPDKETETFYLSHREDGEDWY